MFGRSKDDLFFGAFREHATRSVEAAALLLEMLEHVDRKERLALAIGEKESAGDRLTHETVKRLHETWITPLDRADIHSLITRLDDVLDMIEAVSERVALFRVREKHPIATELGEVLLKSVETLAGAIALVPEVANSSKQILDAAVEANRLENEADDLYRKALGELFNPPAGSTVNALEILKWREIFDYLENATDACEDVANVLEGIVLEYS